MKLLIGSALPSLGLGSVYYIGMSGMPRAIAFRPASTSCGSIRTGMAGLAAIGLRV